MFSVQTLLSANFSVSYSLSPVTFSVSLYTMYVSPQGDTFKSIRLYKSLSLLSAFVSILET